MRHAVLFLATLLLGCATGVPGEIGAPELKLAEDVLSKAAALARASGSTPSILTAATLHSRARGDLGVVREWDQRSQSATTAEGLKDEVTSAVPRDARLAPELSRTLSLCGLVQLLSESSTSPRGGEVILIPTAKFALPIVTAGGLPTAGRYRATYLDVDHPSPCNPQVGDSIAVTVRGQLLRQAIGPIGTLQRLQDVEEKIRCTIGPSMTTKDVPFTSQGDVLQVSCKHESTVGFPIESTHAFLRTARQYIPLSIVRAVGTDVRYQYTLIR